MGNLTRRLFLGGFGAAGLGSLFGVTGRADASTAKAAEQSTARGTVYVRENGGRRGIPGVLVSNGLTFAETDDQGRYEIEVGDDATIWVVKPRGYATPTDDQNKPKFFYHHVPEGTPDDKFVFDGIKPTGSLPESVDFELIEQDEPEQFKIALFGDPQPYTTQEIEFYTRDVTAEFRKLGDVAFGIGLGDLVGDNLALHEPYNQANAHAGFPWYNVVGNHDIEFMSPDDRHADAAFRRTFGPSTFMFRYGGVHFVILNNVYWNGFRGMRRDGWPQRGNYVGRIRPEQLDLLREYVDKVPKDEAICIAMHIPLFAFSGEATQHTVPEARELFDILEGRPHTLSVSGHTHINHVYVCGEDDGFKAGGATHVHHNCGAICGSWFAGKPDPRGIPYSMQRDGVPRGYSVAEFDGNRFKVSYHKLGGPDDEQMFIHLPDLVRKGEQVEVQVNVYDGSTESRTRMRVLDQGDWTDMKQATRADPRYERIQAESVEWATGGNGRRQLADPVKTNHHWVADLPELSDGVHVVEVETTDRYGRTFRDRRMIRVAADPRQWASLDATSIRTPRSAPREAAHPAD